MSSPVPESDGQDDTQHGLGTQFAATLCRHGCFLLSVA